MPVPVSTRGASRHGDCSLHWMRPLSRHRTSARTFGFSLVRDVHLATCAALTFPLPVHSTAARKQRRLMTTTSMPPEVSEWPIAGSRAVHSWEPEMCLIGAAMHNPGGHTVLRNLLELVHDEDIADPKARKAWSTIRALANAGRTSDPATIAAEIRRSGQHGTSTALARFSKFLVDAFTQVPLAANVGEYARAVLDESFRRRIASVGETLIQAAQDDARDQLEDLLASSLAELRDTRSRLLRADQVTAL